MFKFDDSTKTNIKLKMLDLFKTIKANKEIRQEASNVLSVVISNIMSLASTGLIESENVKEIYVINIDLKTNKIPENFVELLNKSINFQTLFCIRYLNEIKYIISIKLFDNGKVKILKIFESDWQNESFDEIPKTSNLESVFKRMIEKVTDCSFKTDENFESYVTRLSEIKRLNKEIEKKTRIMIAEKQPNIKMKLNDEIKQMKKELQELEE